MAQRRMFSKEIVKTDKFLEMSPTAQNLYFHLGVEADDDGFVASPKSIMRVIGTPEDDMKVLFVKGFVIPFESGVVVITHWKENNYIQADRYKPTIHQNEFKQLQCIQNVYRLDTQDRLGKVRIGKDNTEAPHGAVFGDSTPLKEKRTDTATKEETPLQHVVNHFFALKGWDYKNTEENKKNKIVYARFTKPAKELLELCDGDVNEANECLTKVSEWASSRKLDWTIETVFKKWYEIDSLKPKEKQPHYDGCRIFQKQGGSKWYIVRNGEIKELGINPKREEITWK